MIVVTVKGMSPALSQIVWKSEPERYGKTVVNSFATHYTHEFVIEKL